MSVNCRRNLRLQPEEQLIRVATFLALAKGVESDGDHRQFRIPAIFCRFGHNSRGLFSKAKMFCLKVCCLSTLLLSMMPHPSLGKLLSIHVHSIQTIPRSAFPHSHLPGVPYQVAALHEHCAILLQLDGLNTTVPVVPPDTGFPRASFRDNGGGACSSAANLCSQSFVVSF